MHAWRRFGPTHASCVSGSEKGVNYTSHHLRCERIDSATSRRVRRRVSGVEASRSWPGTTPSPEDEEDSYSNVFTPQAELRYTSNDGFKGCSRRTTQPSKPRQTTRIPLLKVPPQCRLPTSIRFTTLILYLSLALFFVSTTFAAPFSNTHAHIHHQRRQSVPDTAGNTGNDPAPVAPDVPPVPLESLPTTLTTLPSFTLPPSSTQPTSTSTSNTGPNSNSNNNNGNGPTGSPGATPPAEELQLTKPQLSLSPGALAGIISGGVVALIVIVSLLIHLYRRTRKPAITEIPIRRSKLGSRLGRRIFGSVSGSRAASRSSSRRSSAALTGGDKRDSNEKKVEGWLDKATISRPKPAPAFMENGLLSVPKPAFVKQEKEKAEEGERWVDKGTISLPRPVRPESAEPLGRLSGLGMGMGYLK